jgi:hypothetical protein
VPLNYVKYWIDIYVSCRFVYGLHPFETIFIKTVWGEGTSKAADKDLGQVKVFEISTCNCAVLNKG